MKTLTKQQKWSWMMDYCQKHHLPPAQSWAWEKAENAYLEFIKSN